MLRKVIMLSVLLALLGCSPTGPYKKKDGKWLFEKETVPVPAGETFTPLNRRFGRSDTVAFFRATPIEGAHAPSFEALSEHYAKDRATVWWADTYRKGQEYYLIVYARVTKIAGAHAPTFTYLGQEYAKDQARVYHEGSPIQADAPTFELLDHGFARDTTSGYYMAEPVPGSDGKTFAVIDTEWSRDAGRVFWSDIDLNQSPPRVVHQTAEGADPASFQALDGGYGKDARRVYFRGKPVEGADPATFVVGQSPDGSDARDRSGGYKEGLTLAAATARAQAEAEAEAKAAAEEAAPPAEQP